jgi:hypothetical protein
LSRPALSFAFEDARLPLGSKEGGEQHVEVIGAALQPLGAQGGLSGLHHGNHQAVAAEGALPGAGRCNAQGRGELLYSTSR